MFCCSEALPLTLVWKISSSCRTGGIKLTVLVILKGLWVREGAGVGKLRDRPRGLQQPDTARWITGVSACTQPAISPQLLPPCLFSSVSTSGRFSYSCRWVSRLQRAGRKEMCTPLSRGLYTHGLKLNTGPRGHPCVPVRADNRVQAQK